MKMQIKPEGLKGAQKAYLRRFLKDNLGMIVGLFSMVLLESLLLVSLPILMKYLVENDYNFFRLQSLMVDLIFISLFVLILIGVSFAIIRLGQMICFKLTNQIKKHWLIHFFQTPSSDSSKLSDGSLMAKMVYHTQLMKMGLERVVLEGGKGAIFYAVILIAALFFSSTTVFWLCLGFPLLCLSFWIAFLIGRHYISQEQTLNSRLIKVLLHQMNNLPQTQSLGLAQERFNDLSNIIEQDTYFRMRRETWLKFSDRLVFALILLSGALLYLVKDFYPILHWNNWSDGAVGIILTGFFTKILIQAIHAGIFWQAMQAGLQISVPEFITGKNPLDDRVKINFKKGLVLQGAQVKLSKFSKAIRDFHLELPPHSKTLIEGKGPVGKTTLAKHLCGLESVDSLNIKNDGEFYLSVAWSKRNKYRQLISLIPIFRGSVGEFLLAKPADQMDSEDIDKIFSVLKKYPQFEFIFQYNEFLGKRFDSFQGSLTELCLLQFAAAIINKPKLICIDNSVTDLNNSLVQSSLEILETECAESIFVYFSEGEKQTDKYNNVYQLTNNKLIDTAKNA